MAEEFIFAVKGLPFVIVRKTFVMQKKTFVTKALTFVIAGLTFVSAGLTFVSAGFSFVSAGLAFGIAGFSFAIAGIFFMISGIIFDREDKPVALTGKTLRKRDKTFACKEVPDVSETRYIIRQSPCSRWCFPVARSKKYRIIIAGFERE